MGDLGTLLQRVMETEDFHDLANNPMLMFGPRTDPFLGVSLLPPQNVVKTMYEEAKIVDYDLSALDTGRYTPPTILRASAVQPITVKLGNHSLALELDAQQYDLLTAYGVEAATNMNASAVVRNFGRKLVAGLQMKEERQRWQALVDAQVLRVGENNYSETIKFNSPTGHRVNAGGTWSNDAYDPFDDILAGYQLLKDKGYAVNRCITSTKVANILMRNDKVRQRSGMLVIDGSGQITTTIKNINNAQLNSVFVDNGLPPVEIYDARWRTETTSGRYLADTVFLMAGTTGRMAEYVPADSEPFVIPNTLGYYGIGPVAGTTIPGRKILINYQDRHHPPSVNGEGIATGFPVILNDEAIFVVKAIS